MNPSPLRDFLNANLGVSAHMTEYLRLEPAVLQKFSTIDKRCKDIPFFEVSVYSDGEKDFAEKQMVNMTHVAFGDAICFTKAQIVYFSQAGWINRVDMDTVWAAKDKLETYMMERSEALEDAGKLAPGIILCAPMADGHAMYEIVKVNKASVKIRHLSFGDAWMDRRWGCEARIPHSEALMFCQVGKARLPTRCAPQF